MNIRVLTIGKLKETYWTAAVKEYEKRLSSYCSLSTLELKEVLCPERASESMVSQAVIAEGNLLLKNIRNDSYVVSLEVNGTEFTSEGFAKKLTTLQIDGKSNVDFIIGGSNGLSSDVLARSNLKMSFSKMTFPHQMIRVFLLEQIYRSYKIIRNETYHK